MFSLELSFEGLAHFLPLGRTLEAVGRLVAESIDSPIIVPSVSRCLVGLMIPSDSSLVGLYQCRLTIQITLLTCGSARRGLSGLFSVTEAGRIHNQMALKTKTDIL